MLKCVKYIQYTIHNAQYKIHTLNIFSNVNNFAS